MISTTSTTVQKIYVHAVPGLDMDIGGFGPSFSDAEFLEFCLRNPDVRIERESNGEIVIMAPTSTETGGINSELFGLLWFWAKTNAVGKSFDSSTGFTLPNGAVRSPDACWIRFDRLSALSDDERAGFARICPDFVVELRSTTDRLPKLRSKMSEYIENGASLGWLIDPLEKRVYVYRPDREVEILDNPTEVSGDLVLTGFTLNLNEIWG